MRCERCNRFFENSGRGPHQKRFCSEYCRKQTEKMRNRQRRPCARRTPSTYGKTIDEIEWGVM